MSADGAVDLFDGFFQDLNAAALVERLRRENVEWRGDQADFDLRILGRFRFGDAEGGFDSVDAFVAKAGDFDVGTNFGGLDGRSAASS